MPAKSRLRRARAVCVHPVAAEPDCCVMTLLLLEALGALVLLIFIVWWTMFSGRHKGELPPPDEGSDAGQNRPGRPD